MIKFNATLRITPGRGLDTSAKHMAFIHQAMDSEIVKTVTPFVPMDTGALAKSVHNASSVGVLVWNAVYAKYQYYGVSRARKGAAGGRPLNYRKIPHPLAGEKWVERAKPVWLPNWLKIYFLLLTGKNAP